MGLFWRSTQVLENATTAEKHTVPENEIESVWTTGHLNHLTTEQEATLVHFKKICKENGYCAPEEKGEADMYDEMLLRFLRSRRFDVDSAYSQFRVYQEWLKEHHLDEFYQKLDVNVYEECRRIFAQWTGHRDRRGFPIYVFPVKSFTKESIETLISKVNSSHSARTHDPDQHLLCFHALYTHMLSFVMPLCTQLPRPNIEIPVSASTHIIDITGVDFTHFWRVRKRLQGASVLAMTYYPETLGRIFVIGASPVFITCWEIIQKWFDPLTLSKISILSAANAKSTLLNHIDAASLPEQYGGTLKWEWGELPNLDGPGRAMAEGMYQQGENGEEEFIIGPVILKGDSIQLLGTIDGKERRGTMPLIKNTEGST